MNRKDTKEAIRNVAMAEMTLEDYRETNDDPRILDALARLRIALKLIRPLARELNVE